MKRRRPVSRAWFGWCAGCAVAVSVASMTGGCGSTGVGNPDLTSDESALVSDGDEGSRAGDTSISIAQVPLFELDTAATVATPLLAATNAERAAAAFSPAGCATATHAPDSVRVTYTFARVGVIPCHAPGQGAAFEGTLDATFAASAPGSPNAIDLTISSGNLRVDGVAVSHQSTLHVTFGNGVRTTHATSTFTADRARGFVTHTADHTWSYDLSTLCFTLDGNSTVTFGAAGALGARSHSTTVKHYVRCGAKEACPNAGGTIALTRTSANSTVVLTFLGGIDVDFYVPSREFHTRRSDLRCTP